MKPKTQNDGLWSARILVILPNAGYGELERFAKPKKVTVDRLIRGAVDRHFSLAVPLFRNCTS